MQLYFAPGVCSLASHIALREAGANFDLIRADIKTHKLAEGGGDFYAVNSKGSVPVLKLDDGQFLTEGPAILQYIADKVPAAKLAPANGTLERTRLQEWLNFVTSELHKTFTPLFDASADPKVKEYFTTLLHKKLGWLNGALAGKTYLTGNDFTIADAYAFVVLNWTNFVGVDLAKYPAIQQFMGRVAARPKVQEALAAEGLTKKAA
jgi:glutathione S-transferase